MEKYLVKVTASRYDYNSEYDHSSSSSEDVAIVASPNPVGLAKLVANVDELNVLMNVFSRPDLSELIKMFGGTMNWAEMCFIASFDGMDTADVEEYLFSKKYPQWVWGKNITARAEAGSNHRFGICQRLKEAGSGYEAMLAIAAEIGIEAVSSEAYAAERIKEEAKFCASTRFRLIPADKVDVYVDILTIEKMVGDKASFASEEVKKAELLWKREQKANPVKENEDEDEEYPGHSESRDITITPFQLPENGILLLSSNGAQSYYCD